VPFRFEKAECLSGAVLNGPWPLADALPEPIFVALDGTENLDERSKLASVLSPEGTPADRAIRFGSPKDLNDGANHSFPFTPRSRIERRLKILAVGMLRQEPVGDDAIDERTTVDGY
jgi:hypothetical protein